MNSALLSFAWRSPSAWPQWSSPWAVIPRGSHTSWPVLAATCCWWSSNRSPGPPWTRVSWTGWRCHQACWERTCASGWPCCGCCRCCHPQHQHHCPGCQWCQSPRTWVEVSVCRWQRTWSCCRWCWSAWWRGWMWMILLCCPGSANCWRSRWLPWQWTCPCLWSARPAQTPWPHGTAPPQPWCTLAMTLTFDTEGTWGVWAHGWHAPVPLSPPSWHPVHQSTASWSHLFPAVSERPGHQSCSFWACSCCSSSHAQTLQFHAWCCQEHLTQSGDASSCPRMLFPSRTGGMRTFCGILHQRCPRQQGWRVEILTGCQWRMTHWHSPHSPAAWPPGHWHCAPFWAVASVACISCWMWSHCPGNKPTLNGTLEAMKEQTCDSHRYVSVHGKNSYNALNELIITEYLKWKWRIAVDLLSLVCLPCFKKRFLLNKKKIKLTLFQLFIYFVFVLVEVSVFSLSQTPDIKNTQDQYPWNWFITACIKDEIKKESHYATRFKV